MLIMKIIKFEWISSFTYILFPKYTILDYLSDHLLSILNTNADNPLLSGMHNKGLETKKANS